ncbi:hypothetical protein AMTR_s00023p00247360 [Amborella trichopoda]|uniref:Uncharacterized protein n=1 Tax=Amborella trichopoda TaxID=13333 RepID=W1NJS1_AMBTC|nr:hypothetical protein AMTR_s00023p00247360 [Amborella trichopoda]
MPTTQNDIGILPLQNPRHGIKTMMTITPEILEEFYLQEPLIQPQDIEMIPSEEIEQDDYLSSNSLVVIRDKEGHPTQKTIQLEGACEDVDSWSKTDPLTPLLMGLLLRLQDMVDTSSQLGSELAHYKKGWGILPPCHKHPRGGNL